MADDEAAAALLDEAPVSLYIDLEEGRRANLESVARAAVAFAAAVRETAFVLDPSMSVRVELVDSTEGSVSLNALIRSLGLGDIITKKRLIALCVTSIAWSRTKLAAGHSMKYSTSLQERITPLIFLKMTRKKSPKGSLNFLNMVQHNRVLSRSTTNWKQTTRFAE